MPVVNLLVIDTVNKNTGLYGLFLKVSRVHLIELVNCYFVDTWLKMNKSHR